MINQTIYSLGSPGTFDITDKTDPLYYIARFNHEMSQNFYLLNQASYKLWQNTQTEFAAIETLLASWMTSIASWLDTAVEDSMDGDPIAALPTPPDYFTINSMAGSEAALLWFQLKFKIQSELVLLRKTLESDTSTTETARAIRDGLIGVNDADETYPLLLLMAQRRTEILLNNTGNLESIFFEEPE